MMRRERISWFVSLCLLVGVVVSESSSTDDVTNGSRIFFCVHLRIQLNFNSFELGHEDDVKVLLPAKRIVLIRRP